MASEDRVSLPLRVLLRALMNIGLVWFLATYAGTYFSLAGGAPALVIIGSLLTLMNLFVRPLLDILTAPLKLFATFLAIILVNGAFVQLAQLIAQRMDPTLVRMDIRGGLVGWLIVAVAFGFGNWLMREALEHA